jgi:hypothetical protein
VSFEIRFNSRVQGPISSGKMQRDAAAYSHDVADAIADSAKDTWLNNLHGSLRHQTPYYTRHIKKRPLGANRYEIHDSGIVYGHWLEGTGSRNAPVTIFPGYHAQERAEAEVNVKRGNIARRILRRYRASGRLI